MLSLTLAPRLASKGPKSAKKVPIVAEIKNKKMGLNFHTINHTIKVFFKVSFLGFVDAPVMCILNIIMTHLGAAV